MAIIYNRYINSEDHTWYDSSNVVYSLCYDTPGINKNVKIVFRQGRTYLYKDVDANDYLMFKNAESNGKAVNKYILSKYKAVRIQDTDIESINSLKENFINENKITDEAFTNLAYHIDYNNDTGEFFLKLNDEILYHGVENHVSIINLFKSMNIKYSMSEGIDMDAEDSLTDSTIKRDAQESV